MLHVMKKKLKKLQTLRDWLHKWMFPMVNKMLDLLSDDGTLVLYVGDTYRTPDFVQLLELHFNMQKIYVHSGKGKRPPYHCFIEKRCKAGRWRDSTALIKA